jgi:hypothetical protein
LLHPTRLWTGPLDRLDTKLDRWVSTLPPVGFPAVDGSTAAAKDGSPELTPDARATLLAVYAGQFGSYTTLLWQVPALSLTAQAFLFTTALAKDADPGARVVTGILSVVASLMSIYLMFSHRIHAERQGRVAIDLALQLGAKWGWEEYRGHGTEYRGRGGAAGVWAGVNRGSFALWILGLGLFGLVGLGAAILGLWQL